MNRLHAVNAHSDDKLPEQRWSNWFFRNPRLLVLVVALAIVAGLSSVVIMPRMEDPPLVNRAGQITTVFPGADPKRVEVLVTDKIEEHLQEIDEIKEFRSSSRTGISVISIELRDQVTDVGNVWSRIRDKLDDAQQDLPPGALESEFDDLKLKAYAYIIALRWTRDSEPNHAILRRLSEQLEDRLQAAVGTEEVERFGDVSEEVLVELKPQQLAARGLAVHDIARQLAASDAKVSAGQLRGQRGDLLLDVDGEIETLAHIGRTPIRYGDGDGFAQLSDIASISKTIADPPDSLAVVGGQRAIVLGVFVRPDYRIDRWRKEIAGIVDSFNATLPSAVDTQVMLDQNEYVQTRLRDLFWNLMMGGAAVLAVILVLMGSSSAVIVGASLPLAAMMVLFGLRVMEIPIHQMSVTGLIIALGLLIDNAIVMVDEVGERLREGLSAREAVGGSVERLAIPLLGSTLTTALAFGPIALMPGPAGEFVGSIGISVILAIASSFLLAMTVVPALAAWGIRPNGQSIWTRGISPRSLGSLYRRSLVWVFRHPAYGLALGVILPIVGFVQARTLPEQFFPPADRDQFQIELELPASTSQEQTLRLTERVREHVRSHHAVNDVHWFIGESAPSFYYNLIPRRKGANQYAQALVQLKTDRGVLPLIRELQTELDREFPSARLLVCQLEQGPPFDAPVESRIFGDDIEQLREVGDQMREILASTEGVLHTRAEVAEALPKLSLDPDEEKARLAGLDLRSISLQLQAALDGAVGGTVLESTEELPIRVRLPGEDRSSLERIAEIDLISPASIRNDGYRGVPLTAIAKARLEPQIAGIPHFNGRRLNEVQGFIQAGMLPAEALGRFQAQWAKSGFSLPDGVTYEWGGEAAKRDDAIGNLMANVGVLAVLMAATLVLSFGSFRLAGLIGTVAALSVGLGLGALWLYGFPFGFMAIVGTMGLIGVAINDAIVVLAALRAQPQAAAGDAESVATVVVGATRHIVATSLTTMAGFAPLVIEGGGFWPPLAVAIAGGVGGATILALYYIPSAYILLMCPRCAQPLAQPLVDSIADRQDAPVHPSTSFPAMRRPSSSVNAGKLESIPES